jgi:cytochrome c oxidase subunit 2
VSWPFPVRRGSLATVGSVPTRTPRRSRRPLLAAAAAAGLAFLAGCAEDAPQDSWDPAGSNAQKIQDLQWPVFLIAGVVGLIVMATIGYIVVKYRDRGQAIPEQTHGKPALEIGLTILPALILIGVAIPTVGTLMALADTDDTECVVNVTGQQWWWEVDYPVQDGCGGIGETIVTSGQMVIPTGTNVLMNGTSRDVIHSWWVPRINGKKDIVPGRVHSLRLQADEPGIYAGQCAEFCGLSHANMRMEIVALSPDDFETWKANQLADYTAPEPESLAAEGEQVFIQQCARCHQVDGLVDADGETPPTEPERYVYSGAAPNLTDLMTRNTFAGASFDLLIDSCRDEVWNAPPDEFGERYLAGVDGPCLNEVQLREWLRDAPAMKPMYTDPDKLEATDGLVRGMPYLGLSEDQIDVLIAYLLERK